MRRVEALIIFILQVSRPLLSNHAIILDDLRWKNLITITSSDKIHLPKGQKLQPLCHYACARRCATRWIEDAMAEPKPKLGIANKGFKVLWKAFWKEQLTGLLSLFFFFLKSNTFFALLWYKQQKYLKLLFNFWAPNRKPSHHNSPHVLLTCFFSNFNFCIPFLCSCQARILEHDSSSSVIAWYNKARDLITLWLFSYDVPKETLEDLLLLAAKLNRFIC